MSNYVSVLNVKDFNVYGDGVTDDTANIQAVIDASVTSTNAGYKQSVYFPPGNYVVTNLQLKDKISLIGAGRDRTIITHKALTAGSIFNNPVTTAAVGNILIEDMSVNFTPSTLVGFDFSRVFMSVISRVNIYFNGSTGIGVSFDQGVTYSAYYNTCYDVCINGYNNASNPKNGIGFQFANSANSNRIENCRTNSVSNPVNIATTYLNQITVIGCAFEQFDTGIICKGTGCSFISNRFEAGTLGVQLLATSTTNYTMGNFFTNVTTVKSIDTTSTNNFIFDYSQLSVQTLGHEVSGGWNTNQNMRAYGIQQVGYLDMNLRSTSVPAVDGRMFYADGSGYNPGDGKGLYISDGTASRKIGAKTSIPALATSAGNPGDYAIDNANGFYYICTAPSVWKRMALSTF